MSEADINTPGSLKLPACEACRKRKVKCDSKSPKCTSCRRSESACIIVDPITHSRYSRDALAQLERKLQALETNSASPSSATAALRSPSESGNLRVAKKHYVGDGSGLNIFKRLSTKVPMETGDGMQTSPYDTWSVAPHGLPSHDIATMLVTRYTMHAQLHHPLLPQYVAFELLQRVYSAGQGGATPEDMYRMYMILAISSVTTYRRGETHDHPYGYYHSAQRYAKQVDFVGSINAIQNLLLVARFNMYYHTDWSIWEVARVCVRNCVALGLHQPPSETLSPLDEQIRRNLFWDCYVHDRFSSGVLGRPYAIAEGDITVDMPVNISEKELLSSQADSLDQVALSISETSNAASVFNFVIKLRRALTRISNYFYSSQAHTQEKDARWSVADAGRVRLDLHRFLSELKAIRDTAPIFSNPHSLYQRPEWYDFLVEKDRLTLIRGALAHMPIQGVHPPETLLEMALQCATTVIELYSTLFSRGQITWTRSYFQILFTSGLSIMHTLSIVKPNGKHAKDSDVQGLFRRASTALETASELMKMFVSEMPDAGRFAVIFDVLVRQYTGTGTGTRTRPSRAPTPPHQHQLDLPAVPNEASNSMQAYGTPMPPMAPDFPTLGLSESLPQPSNVQQMQVDTTDHGTNAMPQAMPFSQDYDHFAFEFGLDDFHNWSLHNNDTMLGQVEAGVGEYAWGMPPDDSLWSQWDLPGFRDPI